ncbi:SDR family NAD(P)-dependent oxidoreductase [Aliamphritea ceti]|uniref:SDR family NAD(P)-dependent oxidoreductase n=1 Tax=Aliamphritea ceti TaxID=1524258 RepID=UPI0021C48F94|nr:SDR family NAD(P)-dependent oxidoreductase [Aliamphritea ceti]
MTFDLTPTKPASTVAGRMFKCIFRQKKKNRICPELPNLISKRALVTGGVAGVGEFISRGLMERGAQVTSLSRGQSSGTGAIPGIHNQYVDLANPETILTAVELLGNTPFDLLILNAGLVSAKAKQTVTGVENTFGINVLGHHILYRLLIERGLLTKDARIIITTGDIYISTDDCSPEIPFETTQKTYARSKLGNLWQVAELKNRYPNAYPLAVHPGVVASGLAGAKTGFSAWLMNKVLVSEKAGAQASLIAATQNLPRGAYWHNTLGLVDLPADDPALDKEKAARLWEQLEQLAVPYLSRNPSL